MELPNPFISQQSLNCNGDEATPHPRLQGGTGSAPVKAVIPAKAGIRYG